VDGTLVHEGTFSVDLSSITFKYWYTVDQLPDHHQDLSVFYTDLPGNCVLTLKSFEQVGTYNFSAELGFEDGAGNDCNGQLASEDNTGEMQFAIINVDGNGDIQVGPYVNNEDDHSFQNTPTMILNERITVYHEDQVYGEEPPWAP
jgi:hypothetical protein